MDALDIHQIKEFLLKVDLGDLNNDDWPLFKMPGANVIGDLPTLQWELLVKVLLFKDVNLLQELTDIIIAVSSVKGATNLTLQFIQQIVSQENKAKSKIKETTNINQKEVELTLADYSLIKKYSKQLKLALREQIDKKGGVTVVAEKAELTQPHLSRILNDESLPRISTLSKLFRALNIVSISVTINTETDNM